MSGSLMTRMLAGNGRAVALPALVYHHVGTAERGNWPLLTVSPARFESHIRWLSRAGFTAIVPGQWLQWRRSGSGLPRKPVLVTFDDAYADTAEHALPVLERYGFAAAVFVVTRHIGGRSVWDQAAGFSGRALMSERQIREWHARGVEFGPHGRTHADLTTMTSDAIDEEIEGSERDLTRLLGSRPAAFAYPYGRVTPQVMARVARRFDLAFVVQVGRGVNDLATSPLAQLRSLVEPQDTALDVLSRARCGVSLRARLRMR